MPLGYFFNCKGMELDQTIWKTHASKRALSLDTQSSACYFEDRLAKKIIASLKAARDSYFSCSITVTPAQAVLYFLAAERLYLRLTFFCQKLKYRMICSSELPKETVNTLSRYMPLRERFYEFKFQGTAISKEHIIDMLDSST